MVDEIQFSILGLDSLTSKFNEISYDLRRRGGRSSLRKAANVVVEAAKQNAASLDDPSSGRRIADNVALRWNGRLFKYTGDLGFRVGVLHGARISKKGNPDDGPGGPTPHWRLLEFGTQTEFGTQKTRAQPFMRRALSENINKVTSTFITEYEKAIDRAIKRAAKRGEQP